MAKGRLDCLEVSGEKGGYRIQVQAEDVPSGTERGTRKATLSNRKPRTLLLRSHDKGISRGTVLAKRYFSFHLGPKCAAVVVPEQCSRTPRPTTGR